MTVTLTEQGNLFRLEGLKGLNRSEFDSVLRQACDAGRADSLYLLPELGLRMKFTELNQRGTWGTLFGGLSTPRPVTGTDESNIVTVREPWFPVEIPSREQVGFIQPDDYYAEGKPFAHTGHVMGWSTGETHVVQRAANINAGDETVAVIWPHR